MNKLFATPISPQYPEPSEKFLVGARNQSQPEKLTQKSNLMLENYYFKNGIRGSLPDIWLRRFLVNQLHKVLASLAPDYGFVIFDGYRSKKTQAGLFHSYFEQIKIKYPAWTDDQLHQETRNSWPTLMSRVALRCPLIIAAERLMLD